MLIIGYIAQPAFASAFRQDPPDAQDNVTKPDKKQKTQKNSAGSEDKPAPYTGPKKRLAVMSPDQQGNTAQTSEWMKILKERHGFKDGDDVGLKLNTMLTTALQNTGRFVLLERQNFGDIRSEQDLASEGQTTAQSGAKKGSVLGAQIMVRCAITEFVDDSVKEGGVGGVRIGGVNLGGGSTRKKAKVTVDVKMFDVATSVHVDSEREFGQQGKRDRCFRIWRRRPVRKEYQRSNRKGDSRRDYKRSGVHR